MPLSALDPGCLAFVILTIIDPMAYIYKYAGQMKMGKESRTPQQDALHRLYGQADETTGIVKRNGSIFEPSNVFSRANSPDGLQLDGSSRNAAQLSQIRKVLGK